MLSGDLKKKSNCCKCARRDSNQGLLYKANQVMLLNYKVLSKWGTILDALRFCLCIFFLLIFQNFLNTWLFSSECNLLIPHTPSNYWEEFVGVAPVEISCCEIFVRIKNYHPWRKYFIKYFVAKSHQTQIECTKEFSIRESFINTYSNIHITLHYFTLYFSISLHLHLLSSLCAYWILWCITLFWCGPQEKYQIKASSKF